MSSKKAITFSFILILCLSVSPWFSYADLQFNREAARDAVQFLQGKQIFMEDFEKEADLDKGIPADSFIVLLAKTIGIQPLFADRRNTSYEAYAKALTKWGMMQEEMVSSYSDKKTISGSDAYKMMEKAIHRFKPSPRLMKPDERLVLENQQVSNDQQLTVSEAAIMMKSLYSLINEKPTPAPGIDIYHWTLKVGEQRSVKGNIPSANRFTPVFGLDHPEIGSLSPEGIFTAMKPGSGMITVTAGTQVYLIHVQITGNETINKKSDSPRLLDVSRQAAYAIQEKAPDRAFHEKEYRQYPGPIEGLASQKNWTGFFRQKGREIRIDLGKKMPVSELALEFQQNKEVAALLPRSLNASLSLDGRTWSSLGQVNHEISPSHADVTTRKFTLCFPAVWARYITLSFPVDTWVFARGLSVKAISDRQSDQQAVILPQPGGQSAEATSLLQVAGINDILLVYTGKNGKEGTWEKEDFQPVISYVKEGKIKGEMFDAILFLPFPTMKATKKEWNSYLVDLFRKEQQLDALNQAVEWSRQNGGSDKKVKVILSLPYPDPMQAEFGSLRFFGRALSFVAEETGEISALQNRYDAVGWYFKRLMEEWKEHDFRNLELSGIYWFQETINPSVAGEKALVRNVSRMVHAQGLQLYWIPYYGAQGIESWEEYGFDYVFLQPNFYANDHPPGDRMPNVMETAKKFRLGVELEMDRKILSSRFFYDLFYKQLQLASELGLSQEATLAYYAGTKTIVDAAKSEIPEARKIYDDLHRWINGRKIFYQ